MTVRDNAGARTTYTWDAENRLIGADLATGGPVTMTYDADGLRRRLQTPSEDTRFVWDDQNVLLETDDQGATQAFYTLAPQRYGDLLSQRRGSDSRFYLFDGLGSTDRLLDENEAVTDGYTYEAFGTTRASSGTTPNPYRYVGRLGYQFNGATGLHYVRARWYGAAMGRFLGLDPVAEGVNRYAYTRNLPVSGVDPEGTKARDCKIVFWIGSSVEDKPKAGDKEHQLLLANANVSKWAFENKMVGYEVVIDEFGTAASLRSASEDDRVVGIATGSHGGCYVTREWPEPNPFLADSVFNQGTDDEYVGASLEEWLVLNKVRVPVTQLAKVKRPDKFVRAHFGHCYTYWNRKHKLEPGVKRGCKMLYAWRLGADVEKIDIPDRSEWDDIYSAFQGFWTHFPTCCPLWFG
jgi:RHS repeat-associated protein